MKRWVRRVLSGGVGFIVIFVTVFGLARAAEAAVIQISAASFTLRCADLNCPPNGPEKLGEEFQGLLLNARGRYFAAVPFSKNNVNVCKFTLWFRDNDGDIDVTARLKRKEALQGGNAFEPPLVMAQVASAGASNSLRSAFTTTITEPKINTGKFFYFVEVEIPGNTLEVLGVQLDVRATCP